jgi:hypothetical protein
MLDGVTGSAILEIRSDTVARGAEDAKDLLVLNAEALKSVTSGE